jgi:hypothetical protein
MRRPDNDGLTAFRMLGSSLFDALGSDAFVPAAAGPLPESVRVALHTDRRACTIATGEAYVGFCRTMPQRFLSRWRLA